MRISIWVLKAIIQKIISKLPFKHSINYFFQKYVTKGVHLSDDYFEDKIKHARNHFSAYRSHTDKDIPFSVFELGTGWYPIVPLYFFLMGSDRITTADLSALLSDISLDTAMSRYLEYIDSNAHSFLPDRIELLRDLAKPMNLYGFTEKLAALNISYLVGDISKEKLDNPYNLICSNNTLEHVYAEDMNSILLSLANRCASESGVQSHAIDLSDHYAHMDKKISVFNFLQFSEKTWSLIDNSVQPMNRLRVDDFRKIFKALELKINEESVRKGRKEELTAIVLAPQFKEKSEEDLLVTHVHFILK